MGDDGGCDACPSVISAWDTVSPGVTFAVVLVVCTAAWAGVAVAVVFVRGNVSLHGARRHLLAMLVWLFLLVQYQQQVRVWVGPWYRFCARAVIPRVEGGHLLYHF